MSNAKHHHFVPKVYLKEFGFGSGNDLKVYVQKINSSTFFPLNKSVGNALCQIEDFYKLNVEKSYLASIFTNKPNIVEDSGFTYEKYLPKIFAKLKYNRLVFVSLDNMETQTLIRALLSIKFRNPFVRETLMKNMPTLKEKNSSLRQDLLNHLEICKGRIDNERLSDIREKLLYDFENEEEFIKCVHTLTMFWDKSDVNERLIYLSNLFYNSQWVIIHSSAGKQFITSDNPGVFLSENGNIYSLILSDFDKFKVDRFFFPISPYHGLLIRFSEQDKYSGENKLIPCIHSPKSASEYNIYHCCHVNSILIGNCKEALKETFIKGKANWVDVKKRI